jgi:8-oxo-dGTP pyrophosphatase MutT (NUDIX family)
VKVVKRETLWEGKFIKAVLISYKDHTGTIRQWEAVSRINCNGVVVIIPVTDNNEVILIRQFRPALDNYVIEFPAGLIDPGEDIISAGLRELIEETGYTSDNVFLFTEGVISTGINTEKWNVLLAANTKKAPENIRQTHQPDENEDIETLSVPLDNAHDTLQQYGLNGDEVDLRIFGLLDLVKKKLK